MQILELHHSKYIKNLNPIVVFMFQRSAIACDLSTHPPIFLTAYPA